ncbi:MAG: hypothetical protein AB1768_06760 [Pseudomonadota bacterium]|jgi:hypothetical protein
MNLETAFDAKIAKAQRPQRTIHSLTLWVSAILQDCPLRPLRCFASFALSAVFRMNETLNRLEVRSYLLERLARSAGGQP